MRRVVILGASGHARVIADTIKACGDTVEAFLDDNTSIEGVAGSISEYEKYLDAEFIIGIGNADTRKNLSTLPVKWYTAIHPSAVVSPKVTIGEGTVVMPNAVINSGAIIGKHTIINTAAVVEHDNVIGDYVHISVGAKIGGTVHVGESTWIGIGAIVNNNISICGGCIIGAGAVVVKDIRMKGTYIGIPAKIYGGGV
ncbi:MAG: putative acetyltransferase EpsM [Firmicutes bacterium ADurb.Bin099]|nr:MAG: putative acetyltransferase EpsM [Firmicutes bacterium ADurb.Bin099]